jgi:hypothetical protein
VPKKPVEHGCSGDNRSVGGPRTAVPRVALPGQRYPPRDVAVGRHQRQCDVAVNLGRTRTTPNDPEDRIIDPVDSHRVRQRRLEAGGEISVDRVHRGLMAHPVDPVLVRGPCLTPSPVIGASVGGPEHVGEPTVSRAVPVDQLLIAQPSTDDLLQIAVELVRPSLGDDGGRSPVHAAHMTHEIEYGPLRAGRNGRSEASQFGRRREVLTLLLVQRDQAVVCVYVCSMPAWKLPRRALQQRRSRQRCPAQRSDSVLQLVAGLRVDADRPVAP